MSSTLLPNDGPSARGPNDDRGPDKPSDAERIRTLARDRGADFRPEYSGRGMFGATCVGIVTSDANALMQEAGRRGINKTPQTDEMGLDTIVYWPSISID